MRRTFLQCIGCLLFLSLSGQCALANDFLHRNFILGEMKKSALRNQDFSYPFISTLDIKKEKGDFSSNSGSIIFNAPNKAVSIYDSSISYDLTDFYNSRQHRARLVLNQFIPGTHLLLSGGFDTGSTAPKIAVSPSWFIGLSGYKKINQDLYLYFTSGSWQNQKVTETPCTDDYGREYWCPALVAWSDRPAQNFKSGRFMDLKIEYLFK